MKWFQFLVVLLTAGRVAADIFVKNEKSKKTKDALFTIVEAAIEGLASQNPDGTPSTTPYDGPEAKVGDVGK